MTTTPTPAGAHSPGAPDLADRLKAQARANVPPAVAEYVIQRDARRAAAPLWVLMDAIGEVLASIEAEGIALDCIDIDPRPASGAPAVRFVVKDDKFTAAAAFAAGLTDRYVTETAGIETFTALRQGIRFTTTRSTLNDTKDKP